MAISIVTACYNEEGIIEKVIRAYYDKVISKIDGSEFIVIDDCSKDSTPNILERLKVEFPQLRVLKTPVNGGHGRAIRMGYESATKEYVFQLDSDDQFEVKDFWRLYTFKDNYDFIIGFRKKRHDPLPRMVLARIIRLMNFIIFGVWIKDANCPFRLIKKEVLDELLKLVDKEALAPNIMISILAKKRGIKMAEVLTTHYKRKTGVVSNLNWRLVKFALKGFTQLLVLKRAMAVR